MNKRFFAIPVIGSCLLLMSWGTALAIGADPDVAGPQLAQAHEHGQQSPAAPQAPPEHRQGSDRSGQPDGQQQDHMMMPQAPMHEMPGMDGHGPRLGVGPNGRP